MLTTKIDHDKLFLWSSQDAVYILIDLNRRNQNIMHEVVINIDSMNPNMRLEDRVIKKEISFVLYLLINIAILDKQNYN